MFHMFILMVELEGCPYSYFEWVQLHLQGEIHPYDFRCLQHADPSDRVLPASFGQRREIGISKRRSSDLV